MPLHWTREKTRGSELKMNMLFGLPFDPPPIIKSLPVPVDLLA